MTRNNSETYTQPKRRRVPSWRERLTIMVSSAASRLLFQAPELEAYQARELRRLKAEVYAENNGTTGKRATFEYGRDPLATPDQVRALVEAMNRVWIRAMKSRPDTGIDFFWAGM